MASEGSEVFAEHMRQFVHTTGISDKQEKWP